MVDHLAEFSQLRRVKKTGEILENDYLAHD